MFVGSLSDTTGMLARTTIPGVHLRGWFTTLVPLADAQGYDLKFINGAPPDTIECLPTAAGLNDGTAPSLAHLNYGADADAEEPRIAVLPVAHPIPVGVPIPAKPRTIRCLPFRGSVAQGYVLPHPTKRQVGSDNTQSYGGRTL